MILSGTINASANPCQDDDVAAAIAKRPEVRDPRLVRELKIGGQRKIIRLFALGNQDAIANNCYLTFEYERHRAE
jgi:hypothetical protein